MVKNNAIYCDKIRKFIRQEHKRVEKFMESFYMKKIPHN